MNKWWWITLTPVGFTKEESRAGVALCSAAVVISVLLAFPEGWLLDKLGLEAHVETLLIILLVGIPAFWLARPTVNFISPDLLKIGDENNARRMAAQKRSD